MSEEKKQPVKIGQKIISCRVKQQDEEVIEERLTKDEWEARYQVKPITIHKEIVKREPILEGRTYKVKLNKETDALYITLNHQIIDGKPQLLEIFINCKNIESHQWIAALTRVVSAVFRTSNDPSFLIDELSSVFCATTGHFTKWPKTAKITKNRFLPSLVAEVGEVIRLHLTWLEERELGQQVIDIPLEKVVETVLDTIVEETLTAIEDEIKYPANASLCQECFTKAVIMVEGCKQCLACSYSKCG